MMRIGIVSSAPCNSSYPLVAVRQVGMVVVRAKSKLLAAATMIIATMIGRQWSLTVLIWPFRRAESSLRDDSVAARLLASMINRKAGDSISALPGSPP